MTYKWIGKITWLTFCLRQTCGLISFGHSHQGKTNKHKLTLKIALKLMRKNPKDIVFCYQNCSDQL